MACMARLRSSLALDRVSALRDLDMTVKMESKKRQRSSLEAVEVEGDGVQEQHERNWFSSFTFEPKVFCSVLSFHAMFSVIKRIEFGIHFIETKALNLFPFETKRLTYVCVFTGELISVVQMYLNRSFIMEYKKWI